MKSKKIKKQKRKFITCKSKKRLLKLKLLYKKGKLKCNSKEVAKSILNDCKHRLLDD